MRRLKLAEELQREQRQVLEMAKRVGKAQELVFVQGVAGSGKTTIALHILKELGQEAAKQPQSARATPVLITYGSRLAGYCHNTLRDQSSLVHMLAPLGVLNAGRVCVTTFRDLFQLALPAMDLDHVLDDDACILELGRRATNRGIHDLLPSQVFSLITTFLRGRPELIGIHIDELESVIHRRSATSISYQMYGDALTRVRTYLLSDYEDWKGDRLDRSGIVVNFLKVLREAETHLDTIKHVTARDLRRQSRKQMGDLDHAGPIGRAMRWLGPAMKGFLSCSQVEEAAQSYIDLLRTPKINEVQWTNLRIDLMAWIRQYGLRTGPVWDRIGRHLSNPVIVVDEVQDLSAIECEALICLWFQLQKKQNSRLVLLGDLNQQITPSGFEWRYILDLFLQRADLYDYEPNEIMKPLAFAGEEDIVTHSNPYRSLNYNYRTTEEIARLVESMVHQVARASLPPVIAERFCKYSIKPATTLPLSIEDKLDLISDQDRVPRILVGDKAFFLDALQHYVEKESFPPEYSDKEQEMLSTIVITEHTDEISSLVSADQTGKALALLSYIPVLACKGLEFDSCVVFGISTKAQGTIEADVISKWYTSFTRAKLKLLIYLTPEEYAYIREAGWQSILPEVADVEERVTDVGQVVRALSRIGSTQIEDAETHRVLGEAMLADFQRTSDQRFLEKAMQHFRDGDWLTELTNTAGIGGAYFEKQNEYLKAVDLYKQAQRIPDQIRCLEAERRRLCMQGGFSANEPRVKWLSDEVTRVINGIAEVAYLERARCYAEIRQWDKALENAGNLGEADPVRGEVAARVVGIAQIEIDKGEKGASESLARSLQKNSFFVEATSIWADLGKWDRALACASKASRELKKDVARRAADIAHGKVEKNPPQASRIAKQLQTNGEHRHAARIWSALDKWDSATRSWIKAKRLKEAEKLASGAPETIRAACLAKVADAYYERRPRGSNWPDAYRLYGLAGRHEKKDKIVQRCREQRQYVMWTKCLIAAGELDSAKSVARTCEVEQSYGDAAECWALTEEWANAAQNWMRLYEHGIRRCIELLGPAPRSRRDRWSAEPFFAHMEENEDEYGISHSELLTAKKAGSAGSQPQFSAARTLVIRASEARRWHGDLREHRNTIRVAAKRWQFSHPPLRLPRGNQPATDRDIDRLWPAFKDALGVFRKQAEQIAETLAKDPVERLLSVGIYYHICDNRTKARELANKMFKSKDEEERRGWVETWKTLDLSHDQVIVELRRLHCIRDHRLIWHAIAAHYCEDQEGRDALKKYFVNWLETSKDRGALELIQKYFPDHEAQVQQEEEEAADIKGDQEASPADQTEAWLEPFLRERVDKLLQLVRELDPDEEDLEDLEKQAFRIMDEPDDVERLGKRWDKAKHCLGGVSDSQVDNLVFEIDETVTKALEAGPIPASRPQAPLARDEPPRTETRPRKKAPRRSRSSPPGFHCEVDLHGMTVDDALDTVRNELDAATKDPSMRCLVFIHGYGRAREQSPINKHVRELLIDIRKKNKRVRQVMPGEHLDGLGTVSKLLLQACPELSFGELGYRNPGITVVLLN